MSPEKFNREETPKPPVVERHSGQLPAEHGGERPVREFDNTTLDEAYEQGRIKTPETPSMQLTEDEEAIIKARRMRGSISQSTETDIPPHEPWSDYDTQEERPRKRFSGKLTAGLASVAVLVGGGGTWAGYNALSDDDPTRQPTNPTTEAPVTPGEADSNAQEQDSEAVEFGLGADEFQDDPKRLAHVYFEQRNKYLIAGIDEKVAMSDARLEVSDEEFVRRINDNISDKFVNELFVEDWKSNPDLVDYVQNTREIGYDVKWARIKTFGDLDEEAYVRESRVESVSSETTDDGLLKTTISWDGYDNSELNSHDEITTGVDHNSMYGETTLTWKVVDGQMKITDVDQPNS